MLSPSPARGRVRPRMIRKSRCHKVRAQAHTIRCSRRTTSIVRYSRRAVIAWLLAVTYPALNHNSGICGVMADIPQKTLYQPYSYTESRVFSLHEAFLQTRFRCCTFGCRIRAKHGVPEAWVVMAHHGRETRIAVARFSSSPFSRDFIRCHRDCFLLPGLARTIGLI